MTNHQRLITKLVDDAETSSMDSFDVTRSSYKTILFLVIYLVTTITAFGLRDDWHQQIYELTYLLEILCSVVLIFGAGVAAINFSVPRKIGYSPSQLLPILALAMGLMIWVLGDVNSSVFFTSIQTFSLSYMSLGVLVGALPALGFLLYQISQGAPTQLNFVGSMILLSASAAGHLLMRTIGQAASFSDVLVWCYFPILILTFLGRISGRNVLRW